jgi:hypothetical protein
MPRKTDEDYTRDFLDIETLIVRRSDSLDFHEVFVGSVRNMLTVIVKERKLAYTEDDFTTLVNDSLWDASEGGAVVRNSDSLDFHVVSVFGLRHLFSKLQ